MWPFKKKDQPTASISVSLTVKGLIFYHCGGYAGGKRAKIMCKKIEDGLIDYLTNNNVGVIAQDSKLVFVNKVNDD